MRNPFIIDEPTCISFSGGRTSAYMLWRVLQAHGGKLPAETMVCFANTGKEDEATLKFVKDCSEKWNVDITWLEYRNNELKFQVVDFETASRKGEPFEAVIKKKNYLPNMVARFCTVEMKVLTFERYLLSIGWHEWINFIGIRADEPRRMAKINANLSGGSKHLERKMPLSMDGVTSKQVGEFWKLQDFDLGLPSINGKTFHGNCDLCFLKGERQIISLIAEKPERAIWWASMEGSLNAKTNDKVKNVGRFRRDRPSYAQMMKFTKEQGDMFSDVSVECFCGD